MSQMNKKEVAFDGEEEPKNNEEQEPNHDEQEENNASDSIQLQMSLDSFVNNTDKVNGQIISQGQQLVVSNEFVVHMTKTFFTTIFAETLQGDGFWDYACYEAAMGFGWGDPP